MTSETPSTRVQRFTDSLRGFFARDLDRFMTLYADDAVHVFPFTPDGMPNRVEGKAAIEAWMRQVDGIVAFDGTVDDLRILEGTDGLAAEWSASGTSGTRRRASGPGGATGHRGTIGSGRRTGPPTGVLDGSPSSSARSRS